MQHLSEELRSGFQRLGFVVIEEFASASEVQDLVREVGALQAATPGGAGVRNVLQNSSGLAEFARRKVAEVANFFLGAPSFPVKITVFDKTPAANWKVPIHQDLSIAVKERIDTEGFHPWSTKEGIPHVIAPDSVLRSVIAVRLHLDAADEQNGALRVIPGSHIGGRMTLPEILDLRESRGESLCSVGSGGVMVMSPLLAHASSPARQPSRRTVLHFEFSTEDLPGKLQWATG
jgi:ectoine hydroxylase-related dioxygenase (phytanoyl-CoA dioxygenase family)